MPRWSRTRNSAERAEDVFLIGAEQMLDEEEHALDAEPNADQSPARIVEASDTERPAAENRAPGETERNGPRSRVGAVRLFTSPSRVIAAIVVVAAAVIVLKALGGGGEEADHRSAADPNEATHASGAFGDGSQAPERGRRSDRQRGPGRNATEAVDSVVPVGALDARSPRRERAGADSADSADSAGDAATPPPTPPSAPAPAGVPAAVPAPASDAASDDAPGPETAVQAASAAQVREEFGP